jgi:hypothetical protein
VGVLTKVQAFDTLSRALVLPQPTLLKAFSVASKAKLSFHSDGATQFSGMDGRIISGKDQTTGEFKGLGINARPFKTPAWSGPTFAVQAWGLNEFEDCEIEKNDMFFRRSEIANPFMTPTRNMTANALILEAWIVSRRRPLASTGYFPNYRAIMRTWSPNSRLFGKRPSRLIALHSPEAALVVHIGLLPHIFPSRSGFRLCSPRDSRSFGLYATYPPDIAADANLDFPPIRDTDATEPPKSE